MLHKFALKSRKKIPIYLPEAICGVIQVQEGMLQGLPHPGKPKRLLAEAGFSGGTGDGGQGGGGTCEQEGSGSLQGQADERGQRAKARSRKEMGGVKQNIRKHNWSRRGNEG